jgi:hypothetical protein
LSAQGAVRGGQTHALAAAALCRQERAPPQRALERIHPSHTRSFCKALYHRSSCQLALR